MPTIQPAPLPAHLPAIAKLLLAIEPAAASGGEQGFAAQFSAFLGAADAAVGPVASPAADIVPPETLAVASARPGPSLLPPPPTAPTPDGKALPVQPKVAAVAAVQADNETHGDGRAPGVGDQPDETETAAPVTAPADTTVSVAQALLAVAAPGFSRDDEVPRAGASGASAGQRLHAAISAILPTANPKLPISTPPEVVTARLPASLPSAAPWNAVAIPAAVLTLPFSVKTAKPQASRAEPGAAIAPALPADPALAEMAAEPVAIPLAALDRAQMSAALPGTSPIPGQTALPAIAGAIEPRKQSAKAEGDRPLDSAVRPEGAPLVTAPAMPVEVRPGADSIAASQTAPFTSASAVPAASPDFPSPTLHFPARHDFAALIDRLVEARQAAQATMSSQTVVAAVNHAEFGPLSLQFQQDAAGLSVTLAGNDPDLARAVQAAAPAGQSGTSGSEHASPQRQDAGSSQSLNTGQPQSQLQQRGQSPQPAARETRETANPDPQRGGHSDPQPRGGIFA